MEISADAALKLAVEAGRIMLQSGAETYRVEDTMKRILNNCGYEDSESFVTTTGIFTGVNDGVTPVTVIKRVRVGQSNFGSVAAVNEVSRDFAEKKITIAEAFDRLREIGEKKPLPLILRLFASGLSGFGFAYVFRGGLDDCLNAFLTGFLLMLALNPLKKRKVAGVLVNGIGGAIISTLALIFINLGIGSDIDKVIIGSLMPLLPGVATTNAVRDIFEGDFLSGTARIVDAVIVAVSLAAGVGMALKIWLAAFGTIIIG